MRRRGREAEGGGLLNRYTVKSRIEGSNPSVSATAVDFVSFFGLFRVYLHVCLTASRPAPSVKHGKATAGMRSKPASSPWAGLPPIWRHWISRSILAGELE
jgi:hypothetical protein